MDERLVDGQPPLRVSEVATRIGYSDRFVQKLMRAGAVSFVQAPCSPERRVPVREVRRLMIQLCVGVEKGEQGEKGERKPVSP
jgi:hypothetical protein